MINDLRSPDSFDTRLGERASANVTPWAYSFESLKIVRESVIETFFAKAYAGRDENEKMRLPFGQAVT